MTQLSQFLTSYGGSVLFLVILAEQLGLPIPAAPVLVAAGALAANGELSPASAIGVTMVACVLGDLIWFYAGRQRGSGVLQLVRRIFRCDSLCFERAERSFARFGISAVVGAKFVPGVGFLIPAFAGAFRIDFAKFLRFDLLGSLLYGAFYVVLGMIFSSQVNSVLTSLGKFGLGAVGLVLLAFAVIVGWKHVQQRKSAPSRAEATALMTVSGA